MNGKMLNFRSFLFVAMQTPQRLIIENMICDRCITVVKYIMKEAQINYQQIGLGWVEFEQNLAPDVLQRFSEALANEGLFLVQSEQKKICTQIKATIIACFQNDTLIQDTAFKLSLYLEEQLKQPYPTLAYVFSKHEAQTIEKYFIKKRIDFAKLLLQNKKLNINEISDRLGFSSSQHFSNQFKQYEQMSPNAYRKLPSYPHVQMSDE